MFPFSSREGTVAARLPNHINGNIKKERVNKLIKLSKELGKVYYERFLGKTIEVLFETHDNEDNMLSGYSKNYIKVNCEGEKSLINSIRKVKLSELIEKDNDYEMKGELINELC